jgi:glycosyltransferase involved in cell wall biosynthesis
MLLPRFERECAVTISTTVLTCCFNAERFLETAVRSVLAQTFDDFEFLLVNDGSIDSTPEILERFAKKDPRIRLLHKKHTGLTDSLNTGLNDARGEWIARLDADDEMLGHRLAVQTYYVRTHPAVRLLGSGCLETDESGGIQKEHRYPETHESLMQRIYGHGAFFPHSSALFHRETTLALGGYRSCYFRAQDRDLWLRIAETGEIACIDEPLVRLRKHREMLSFADGGRSQPVLSLCALICHQRRLEGLSDPSEEGGDSWNRLCSRVESRLESIRYFRDSELMRTFRKRIYAPGGTRFSGLQTLASHVISRPGLSAAFFRRFGLKSALQKIVSECVHASY